MEPAASPQDRGPFRPPHPLAVALIDRLRGPRRVLEFASGSGRNSAALARAGFTVIRIDDATAASPAPFAGVAGPFDAAISTHGLLHGRVETVSANLAELRGLLGEGGLLCATFGSTADARYGAGERLDHATFAPRDGDEAGIPHAFFDRDNLAALLRSKFAIESLDEIRVDEVAGSPGSLGVG